MKAGKNGIVRYDGETLKSQEATLAVLDQLFDVYTPGTVFSSPTAKGDYTVITAAEVNVGLGVGFGAGGGGDDQGTEGSGGGGGGGGASAGRPVAAIIIGPQGVEVQPIVDVTKLGIAFFTTLGAILMVWRAMQRRTRGK